ncbi:MAG TPA: hypothetical protein VGC79_16405, partial [Polyangiaceae bacterium]
SKLKQLEQLAHDTRGAGFVEYIILVGVVALFCIGGYTYFGGKVTEKIKAQGDLVTGIKDKE